MAVKGPYEFPHYYIGLSTDTKPTTASIGDEFFETNTRLTYIFDGSNWSQKVASASGSDVYYEVTNPALNAAVTTAIVDAYGGVIITLSTTGNAQTIANPTIITAGKVFVVVNNDTSTNTITVNTVVIAAGKAQSFIWDGSAWSPIDVGIMSIPVTVVQGGTGSTTGNVSGLDFSTPPAIGGTTPGAGAFTTLLNTGIHTATGGIAFAITTHSASENVTAASMYGNEHLVTGAYTETLPATVLGMHAPFRATTATIMSIDCQVADAFVLGGVVLAAGNKITTDGSAGVEFEVICLVANRWTVRNITGVVIDGGA